MSGRNTRLLPASFLQRGLWPYLRAAGPAHAAHVRALRLTGGVDERRLTAAVREVCDALPVLAANLVECPNDSAAGVRLRLRVPPQAPAVQHTDLRGTAPQERDTVCVALLRTDRDRPVDLATDPLARFHLVRLTDEEIVLGLATHSLILDPQSVYQVLGAVCQAYFGRFRAEQHRDLTTILDFEPLGDRARAARERWWRRRLSALPRPTQGAATEETEETARATRTHRLTIPSGKWHGLTALGGPLGGNSALAVVALGAWCLREEGRTGTLGFSTTLDLRAYLEAGPVVGLFSDRLVFGVDLTGLASPSFREVLLRTQAGFLDAVAHYLPYDQVVRLGVDMGRIDPSRTARHWDVALHFCRNPPTSSATRGERTLAEHGLSIELFREADLLGAESGSRSGAWDGTGLDLHLGELGQDTVLVLDAHQRDPNHESAPRLLTLLDRALGAATTDPNAPLPTNRPV